MANIKLPDWLTQFLFSTILKEISNMSDKIDALVQADADLVKAVNDALDKIAAAADAVATAAADEQAITDATDVINAQVAALRAVVPPVEAPTE